MADTITKSIIVKADVSTAYRVWENFENFPYFMDNIKSVTKTGERKSHWVVEGPLGKDIRWNAETTKLEADKRIGWNTKDEEGNVTTSGQVTFNQLPENQTEVTVMMQYDPEGGKVGEAVAKIFANPEKRVEEDLENYKKYIEGMTARSSLN